MLEEQLFHHELITQELLDKRLRVAVGKNYQAALARRNVPRPASQGSSTPLWQRLDELKVPMTAIYGRDDGGDPAARVDIVRQRYPGLEYHVFDGCKHLIQIDCEAQFVEVARRFLPSQARESVPIL